MENYNMNKISFLNINGIIHEIGLDTSDANATENDILSGKSAYVKGNKIIGTIPSQDVQIITPGVDDKTIPSVRYLSGDQIIRGDKNPIPSNIKNGVNIFNVIGSLTGIDDLDLLASMYFTRGGYNAVIRYWNGSTYTNVDAQYGSATLGGTIVKVIIVSSSGGNICGHSGAGIYDSFHTKTISGLSDGYQSFAVLGIR